MATIGAAARPARFQYLRDLWSRRQFILHLARGNLAARNAEANLGKVWWFLNPLIMTAVYFIVFGLIIQTGDRSKGDFLGYLIVGVFVYRYLSQGLIDASKMILNNEKLIVNIRFPRLVLPIAAVLESLTMFVISLPVIYMIVTPVSCIQEAMDLDVVCTVPTWRAAILPFPVLMLGLFTLGVSSYVARWVLPVRDVRDVIPHLTRMWFYFSPVLWGTERIVNSDWNTFAKAIVTFNPMWSFLSLFRFALIGDPFELTELWKALAWTVVAFAVGVWAFTRHEDDMARYL